MFDSGRVHRGKRDKRSGKGDEPQRAHARGLALQVTFETQKHPDQRGGNEAKHHVERVGWQGEIEWGHLK